MKELSRITETFSESVIREMTRICDKVGGINLSQGFPDFEAPAKIKLAAINAITAGLNQYSVTFGEPELRDAICKKAGSFNAIDCDPQTDITVTCGATEAMMATFKALINPGDEFIVFEPYYENYGPDGILSGAIPRFVELHAPHWNFDYDELSKAFNNKTKAIVINTPNNPTGKVFTRAELEQVAELCLKWDVFAITDEIYEHIIYDGKKHISIATLPGMRNRTVTINSISKTYSVTGWRVGWAIASSHITSRIRKVHDFFTVGAPTPLQHAAAAALQFSDDYYTLLAQKYEISRDRLYDILFKAGFKPVMPSGAYYMLTDITEQMPKLQSGNDIDFSKNLICKCGVASVPGSSFFSDKKRGSNIVRFAFCKDLTTLDNVEEKFRSIYDI